MYFFHHGFKKKVFQYLEQEKEAIKENWAGGTFTTETLNSRQIGVIEGINKVLFMEAEDGE